MRRERAERRQRFDESVFALARQNRTKVSCTEERAKYRQELLHIIMSQSDLCGIGDRYDPDTRHPRLKHYCDAVDILMEIFCDCDELPEDEPPPEFEIVTVISTESSDQ